MKLRLFLTCWILFSLHFATNVVREHYPAFTLIERGDFVCDRYAGFHSDIFLHTDGHWYIGNNVMGSVIAAGPLFVFDPLLDRLEEGRQEALAETGEADYDTPYPNRARFFRRVRAEGLDLRFGASAVITSVFLMAPLCALLVILVYGVMVGAGVPTGRAAWVAMLFALATPVFYRSAHLNHNVFLTCTVLASFLCVWPRGAAPREPGFRPMFWGGFFSGMSLALDYAGVIPLLITFGYLVIRNRSVVRSLPFVVGSVPPVLFLVGSQWGMYGNPFLPGQFHMADVNYTDQGWRGFGLPDVEVFFENLFSLDYGLYAYGPLLLLALLPVAHPRVLPRRERHFVAVLLAAFLVFQCCNQYSRMQWNSGFRYLLPLVPLIFLQASDRLATMPRALLGLLSAPLILHGWVLSMHRYTPPDRLAPGDDAPSSVVGSWSRFLQEGVDFPWLQVVRSTSSVPVPLGDSPLLPYLLLAVAGVMVAAVWRFPRRPRAGEDGPKA